MLVIPAIDLKGGRCVRLKQGRMSEETVYSDAPEEIALKWFQQGAERLHVVDLDGAVRGEAVHRPAVKRIVDSIPIPVQLGGGIRSMDTIRTYFDSGVHSVILGTAAFKNPKLLRDSCKAYPGRIILGLDAKEGRIAVEGWTQETKASVVEIARVFEKNGLEAIIYTDINKDGMGSGPNIETTKALALAVKVPIIASGGIKNIEDVRKVLSLSEYGLMGMITGRALYEGTLDLSEATNVARQKSKSVVDFLGF